MKFDLVVTYYDELPLLDHVLWGLSFNREVVNRIIFSKDGLFTPEESMQIVGKCADAGFEIQLVHGPKVDGFGVSAAMNRGVRAVTTDFFLHLDADSVPVPRTLLNMAAWVAPNRLVFGIVHGIPRDSTVESLKDPDFIEIDPASLSHNLKEIIEERPWHIVRGAFFLADTEGFLEMGGWDETMTEYGYQDSVFGMRWMEHYGSDKLGMAQNAVVLHLQRRPENPLYQERKATAERPNSKNHILLFDAVAKFYRVDPAKAREDLRNHLRKKGQDHAGV